MFKYGVLESANYLKTALFIRCIVQVNTITDLINFFNVRFYEVNHFSGRFSIIRRWLSPYAER